MDLDDKKPESQSQTAGWVFHPGDSSQTRAAISADSSSTELPKANTQSAHTDGVHWTASEYVAHDRGAGWYMGLGLGAIVLTSLVYLLTRDYISATMIIVVVSVFGAFAMRRPRVLEYFINDKSITIGTKSYPFEIFKSFSVAEEGAIPSLLFMPLKRFMPIISVYYAKADEDKILKRVSNFLPFEEYRPDIVDKMMHKIRF